MTPRALAACLVLAMWAAVPAGALAAKAKPAATKSTAAKPISTDKPVMIAPTSPVPPPVPPRPTGYNPAVGRDTGQFLPAKTMLARVGARTITVDQYVERYFGFWPELRPRPDSAGRVDFLSTMIAKDVLGQLALSIYKDDTFEDRMAMKEHEDRVLSNILFQRAVYDSIHVTDADAYRIYPQYGYELQLKRLVFRDSVTARRVRDAVAKGRMTWTVAAAQQGLAPEAGLQEGDMGWVRHAALDPEVASIVFDVKPGQISPVMFEVWGYTVYQVMGRREISKAAFESVRTGIIEELKMSQATRRSEAMLTSLRGVTGMVHDTANIAWASHLFPEVLTTGGPGGRGIEMNTSMPEFDPSDTSRVLARFPKSTYTLGQFMSWYGAQSPYTRVSANTFQALRRQVDIAAQEPYMAQIARDRGLEKDSLAASLIDRRREELRVERLYQDSVASHVRITDKDRRDFYNKNQAGFMTYSRVHFATFHATRQSEADSLLAQLKSGTSPAEIMVADSLAGHPRGAIWWRSEVDSGVPHQRILFGEMRPGDVKIDPAPDGHWDVLKSLEFDPGHQLRFDEAEMIIDENLQNQRSQRLLDDIVERHKRAMGCEAHPELVMRIRLVDPTL